MHRLYLITGATLSLLLAGCADSSLAPNAAPEVRMYLSTVIPGQWIRNPATNHEYMLTDPLSWQDAEALAVQQGGHLVTLNDAAEEAWVRATFGGDEHFLIGMNDIDQEGTWVWVSGEPVTYTNWAPGEPNNCGGGPLPGCNPENVAIMNWCREGGHISNPCIGDVWNDLPAGFGRAILERGRTRPSTQTVSGHAELDLTPSGVPVEKYSFTAVRHTDGRVDGRFVVRDPYVNGNTARAWGRVTCFTILADGKTARLGGIIDRSDGASRDLAGWQAAWTVQDNGEGKGATDIASDLRFGFAPTSNAASRHCRFGLPTVENALDLTLRGNIQVNR